MILSENQLKVPGKMFKIRVRCVSTRRLTTIEWLILSCTQKFNNSYTMSEKTLKYAFEEVFQLQNSELLIKPCLRNLCNLKVIGIAGNGNFDYNNLKFKDIEVTELGQYMLKEGLLPGEPRDFPLDIYYNPLTGKINSSFMNNVDAKEAINFGSEMDYHMDFPEKHVICELQAGALGGGRFTASKFRIEEVDTITSIDWENVITMTADVNEDGVITTNPGIIEDGMKKKIDSLFLTKEITPQVVKTLPIMDKEYVQNIIGSGKNLKYSILEVCKNGKVLFMDARVYALYKRNTASFKETTIFLFHDEDGFSVDNEKSLIIRIPDSFPVEDCAVINEKGAHVCLGKTEYTYEEQTITVPLAYEKKELSKKNKIAMEWLQNVIAKNCVENIQYVSLFTLPILNSNLNKCRQALFQRWNKMELSEIISELDKIHLACIWLRTDMLNIDVFADVLIGKINFAEYESALKSIKSIMDTNSIRKYSESHRKMVEKIMEYIKTPPCYRELFLLLQSLGITSHDEALYFDDLIGKFYSKSMMSEIIASIAAGTFTRMPELFEFDVFFNDYYDCIASIELHVSGLKLFEKCEATALKESVFACPDIASLQSYIAELYSKNVYLLKTKRINVHDVLKKTAPERATAFTENMKLLEQCVNSVVNAVYEEVLTTDNGRETAKKEEIKRKIYILDTCAFMHHPDILMYVEEDAYVRIPTKVIDELRKIKDKRNRKYGAELSDTARIIAREIDRTYMPLFNRKNKIRLMVENASLDLLPRDLDPNVSDNQILSVALKYKDWDAHIISDDGVFILAAAAQNIEAVKSDTFIEQHKSVHKSLEERIKEYNSEEKRDGGQAIIVNQESEIASNAQKEEKSFSSDFTAKEIVNTPVQKMLIDDLPVRELKKYISDFKEPVFTFLLSNQIKTIGDFRNLTESRVRNLSAKGKQLVYKNTIMRAVKQMDNIISQVKLK